MKSLIHLNLSNYKLKTKFNKKTKQELYYIINENYLKQIKNYSLIEKEFKNIDLNEEIKEAFNYDNNDNMFDKLIEGKKIAITIKKILSKKDNNSNQNNLNEIDIPNLIGFNCNNIDFFYYDQFRLLELSLVQKLNENGINLFKNKDENIVKCYIIQTYILIDVSKNNNNMFEHISEICMLTDDNKIKPIYLLAYYNKNHFVSHINYILELYQYSFKTRWN